MEMMADSVLKATCFDALVDRVGYLNTERFVMMMNQDPFDYTEWRKTQFCDDTAEELGAKIMAFAEARKKSGADNFQPELNH